MNGDLLFGSNLLDVLSALQKEIEEGFLSSRLLAVGRRVNVKGDTPLFRTRAEYDEFVDGSYQTSPFYTPDRMVVSSEECHRRTTSSGSRSRSITRVFRW